jgi:ferritin
MMMVQYLLDAGVDPAVPGVEAPQSAFADIVAPVALGLDQERRVSDQIGALAGVARDESDYASEQFMQWFIREQVEEVATMSDLLRVVERARDNPLLAEEFLARENLGGGEGADAGAPAAAGGAI